MRGEKTLETKQRRRLDFSDWNQALADIDHLCQKGYEKCGNWDLTRILDHVGEGLRTAVHGNPHRANFIVQWIARRFILPGVFKRRRMQAGIKVPDWWLPGPERDERPSVEQFQREIAAFQAASGPLHPHPFFGPLSKEEWNNLALIHAGHHLSFLIPKQ